MNAVYTRKNEKVQDPAFARFLFADTRAAWIWLVVRLWLGWEWIDASMHKVTAPEWVQTGEAVKGFWERAVAIPEVGRPPITFEWYRSFLQMLLDNEAYTYMGPLIAYGELFIGIGLILGAFTGIAAFFGALLNWNFMMAGTASSNPLLFALAIGIILAWKVAGYVGADYFLLRFLGTPWHGKTEKPVVLVPGAAAAD